MVQHCMFIQLVAVRLVADGVYLAPGQACAAACMVQASRSDKSLE